MCESVENYANMRVKEESLKTLISSILKMKDKIELSDIADFLNTTIEQVQTVLSYNSSDIEYIASEMLK